jgi:hypothetical protein
MRRGPAAAAPWPPSRPARPAPMTTAARRFCPAAPGGAAAAGVRRRRQSTAAPASAAPTQQHLGVEQVQAARGVAAQRQDQQQRQPGGAPMSTAAFSGRSWKRLRPGKVSAKTSRHSARSERTIGSPNHTETPGTPARDRRLEERRDQRGHRLGGAVEGALVASFFEHRTGRRGPLPGAGAVARTRSAGAALPHATCGRGGREARIVCQFPNCPVRPCRRCGWQGLPTIAGCCTPCTTMFAPAVMSRLTLLAQPCADRRAGGHRAPAAACRALLVELTLEGWPSLLPPPPVLAFRITPAGLLEWCGDEPLTQADLRCRSTPRTPRLLLAQLMAGEAPAVQIEWRRAAGRRRQLADGRTCAGTSRPTSSASSVLPSRSSWPAWAGAGARTARCRAWRQRAVAAARALSQSARPRGLREPAAAGDGALPMTPRRA